MRALRSLPILAGAFCLVGMGWLCPVLDNPLSAKADAHWLDEQIDQEKSEVLGCFRRIKKLPSESTALSFYGKFKVDVLNTEKEMEAYGVRQPGDVLLVKDEDMESLLDCTQSKVTVVRKIRIGSDTFFAVRLSPNTK